MTLTQLEKLHALCFTEPRPWKEAEFRDILSTTGAFLLSRQDGFLLGRVIADEAELLTIAVDPAARRAGTGRDLMDEFNATSREMGATTAFLEVAANNAPAQALYKATGWRQVGRRRGYYGPGLDAIAMHLALETDE